MVKYKVKLRYIDHSNDTLYDGDEEKYKSDLRNFNIDLINSFPDGEEYFEISSPHFNNIKMSGKIMLCDNVYYTDDIISSYEILDGKEIEYFLLILKIPKMGYNNDLPF